MSEEMKNYIAAIRYKAGEMIVKIGIWLGEKISGIKAPDKKK